MCLIPAPGSIHIYTITFTITFTSAGQEAHVPRLLKAHVPRTFAFLEPVQQEKPP